MMRPRPTRYVRSPVDGRILSVRYATDPVFETLWLFEDDVRAFFAACDRARRIAAGSTPGDEDEREREERAARSRLMARLARESRTR